MSKKSNNHNSSKSSIKRGMSSSDDSSSDDSTDVKPPKKLSKQKHVAKPKSTDGEPRFTMAEVKDMVKQICEEQHKLFMENEFPKLAAQIQSQSTGQTPVKAPKSKKGPKKPEPPKSAFKFFLMKKLAVEELPKGPEIDKAKRGLKEKFLNLREKKLLKYIKKAVKDKERYDDECAEYLRLNPERTLPKTKPSISKDQWKLYAKVIENRPVFPAPTAYLHYCSKKLTDMYDNHDDRVPTARMQTASNAWNNLSQNEKKEAVADHIAEIEKYIEDMEAWLADVPEKKKARLLADEPKVNPDYWRKKIVRMRKAEVKKEQV